MTVIRESRAVDVAGNKVDVRRERAALDVA